MFCDTLHRLERKWLVANANGTSTERFGQWFANNYIKRGNLFNGKKEMYQVSDIQECRVAINQWLVDNQYENELPPKVI